MICKLLRPMQVANPAYSEQERQRALRSGSPYYVPRDIWIEKGAEIDDPQAWRLVRIGVAEPVDNACKLASGNLTDDQISLRILNYEKVDRGIGTGKARFDGSGEPGKRIPAGLDLGTAGIELQTDTETANGTDSDDE